MFLRLLCPGESDSLLLADVAFQVEVGEGGAPVRGVPFTHSSQATLLRV